MNEKTINEQYAYIRTLLEEKRLKEALMQLESLLWQVLTGICALAWNNCRPLTNICWNT